MNIHRVGSFSVFIFSPFIAFLMALKSFHLRKSKKIVYLFLVFFGITFVLGNEALDSYNYAEYFKVMATLSYSDFARIFSSFYVSERTLDLAQPIISFFISRLSDDHRFLFGAVAAIFAFYYLRSVDLLYVKYLENKNINTLFFLLWFSLILNPIFNINGWRFYTALWIFFLGSYNVILYRNKKYLFLCFFSILFHFSFIIPFIFLVLFYFIGNRNKIYYVFLASSFFVGDIFVNLFPHIDFYLTGGISQKAARYFNADAIELVRQNSKIALEQGKWYLYLPSKIAFTYLVFAFFYVKFKYNRYIITPESENIYSFSVFILAVTNTFSFIPSLSRFELLFFMFAILFILRIFTKLRSKKIYFLTVLGFLPFLINLIVVLRLGLDVVNPWSFFLSPLPFILEQTSIYNLIFS